MTRSIVMTCDQCGAVRPDDYEATAPWLDVWSKDSMQTGNRPFDLCSWACIAEFAFSKAHEAVTT